MVLHLYLLVHVNDEVIYKDMPITLTECVMHNKEITDVMSVIPGGFEK